MPKLSVRLEHADCLIAMHQLAPESIDMVLTDLPYGHTARNAWDVPIPLPEFFSELSRIVKPNAAVVLFGQGSFTASLVLGPWARHWRYNLVWQKNKPRGFFNARRMPLRYHEDILVFAKKTPRYFPQMLSGFAPAHACTRKSTGPNYGHADGGVNLRAGSTERYPGSVLRFPVINAEERPVHPTQKPVELLRFLIRSYSLLAETILNPCAGSASTGVAAVLEGRGFIGYEKDAGIYASAQERLVGNLSSPADKA